MELDFRKLRLEDKESFKEIFIPSWDISAGSAFGSLYLWSEAYDLKICFEKNVLFQKIGEKYYFPKGLGDSFEVKAAVETLRENAGRNNEFSFVGLLQQEKEVLEEIFPGKFSFSESRNDFEYIYSIESLAQLRGKKYHSKRNHISKFNKLYNWEYITCINKNEYLDFFQKWFRIHRGDKETCNPKEYDALKKALDNFEALGLISGAVKVDGEMVACSIGEGVGNGVLIIHFEKALPEFEGAYSVINSEFCKHNMVKYNLVNREEDLGIAGLRKAKLSYKPKVLLKKYNAIWED